MERRKNNSNCNSSIAGSPWCLVTRTGDIQWDENVDKTLLPPAGIRADGEILDTNHHSCSSLLCWTLAERTVRTH